MFKMFTEAVVKPMCIDMNIYGFSRSTAPLLYFVLSLFFVLSFRCLCTGLINFCSLYE